MPAAGGAQRTTLIKIPKVTTYPVSIDVAGYIDFDWTFDSRRPCIPGYAVTINEELSLELGKPRHSVVNVFGGDVTMPFAIGGQMKLKTIAKGFQTSNYCDPTPPAPEPKEPECRTLTGKLGVVLSPQKLSKAEEETAPLRRDVLISFARRSGSSQSASCLAGRPTPEAINESKGVYIDTTPRAYSYTALPLRASALDFAHLKPGKKIAEKIAISGGCDRITASASALSENIKRCTVKGRVVVVIKRLK